MKVLTIRTKDGPRHFTMPDENAYFDGQRIEDLVNHHGAHVAPLRGVSPLEESYKTKAELSKEKGNRDV